MDGTDEEHSSEQRKQQQQQQPPALNYPLAPRRLRSLTLAVALLVLINIIAPCAIYYPLFYSPHTHSMAASDMYGFVSIPMGLLQVPQWPWRLYLLARARGARSPITRTPADSALGFLVRSADTFQVGFLIGIIAGAIPLILASSINAPHGSFVALALTYPIIIGAIGLGMLVVTALSCSSHLRQPLRMSSVPKHERFRPALAYLWEDLTAVEGGGGQLFRQAFGRRYSASPRFRRMLTLHSFFLALAFLLYFVLALILTLILDALDHHHAAAALHQQQQGQAHAGHRHRVYEPWSLGANMLLFSLWHSIVALIATRSIRRHLREEDRTWAAEHGHKTTGEQPVSAAVRGDHEHEYASQDAFLLHTASAPLGPFDDSAASPGHSSPTKSQ